MNHSLHSPSKAAMWMACPGSIAAGQGIPDSSSKFADEGSAAHALAAHCLINGLDPLALEGWVHPEWPDWPTTKERAQYIQVYVDHIREFPGDRLVEQRLDLTPWIDEPRAGGTADALILQPRILDVHDLKYGKGVKVFADGPQLKQYALGAVRLVNLLHGCFPEEIRLHIHQPRLDWYDKFVMTAEELMVFGEQVVQACRATLAPDAPRIPGEAQCQWCKARATCPELATAAIETVTAAPARLEEFMAIQTDPAPPMPPPGVAGMLPPADIAALYARLPLVKTWMEALEKEAMALGLRHQLPGYKIVEGRRGNTNWTRGEAVEAALRDLGVPEKDSHTEPALRSPAQIKKLMQSDQWVALEALTTRPPGKPTLAPESDKRPAMATAAETTEFADLDNPEEE